MRKKFLLALIGVMVCVGLASNPGVILAEDAEADSNLRVSLRERVDTNGDGTIDDAERAAFREKHLKRFDRNNDGKIDRNERRHARRMPDRAEDRWDRREDRRDRREDRWDRREDRRDRKEDIREFKRDRRHQKRHVSRNGGRGSRR